MKSNEEVSFVQRSGKRLAGKKTFRQMNRSKWIRLKSSQCHSITSWSPEMEAEVLTDVTFTGLTGFGMSRTGMSHWRQYILKPEDLCRSSISSNKTSMSTESSSKFGWEAVAKANKKRTWAYLVDDVWMKKRKTAATGWLQSYNEELF